MTDRLLVDKIKESLDMMKVKYQAAESEREREIAHHYITTYSRLIENVQKVDPEAIVDRKRRVLIKHFDERPNLRLAAFTTFGMTFQRHFSRKEVLKLTQGHRMTELDAMEYLALRATNDLWELAETIGHHRQKQRSL